MIVVSIDPGLTGAAAFIKPDGSCIVEDLPTVRLPGDGLVKSRIDGRALSNMLLRHCPVGVPVMAVMEQVGTMGGKNNAVQTQGSLMRSLGAVETVLEMLRMPPKMVHPKTWKKFFGLKSDKKESLAVARTLYPDAPLNLAKHHNRAEAVLIGHWATRKLT